MQDLVEELEKKYRAAKGAEARSQSSMNDALDMQLQSLADVHDVVRHYHHGRWEALHEVLTALKELDA